MLCRAPVLRIVVILVIAPLFWACDSFKFNPNSPSPISRNTDGPEIRIHPNVGAPDYKRMFTNPDEWAEARSKISVFQFHHANTLSYLLPTIYTPDGGTNHYNDFVSVDAFRKLAQWGIPVSIEMGSLKHFNCENPSSMLQGVNSAIEAINNVKSAGGIVIDVSMDEPFMGGMVRIKWDGINISGCNYTSEESARFIFEYWMKPLMAAHPDVQVGLTEVYPRFSIEELERNVIALENLGYHLPFLHVDYDRYGGIIENKNPEKDLARLQEFLHSRGIKLGLVIWGESGTSTESWYNDAMAMATRFRNALGNKPDRIIIESWSRFGPPQNGRDPAWYPEVLPESRPGTMTYMVNQMSLFFR